MQGRPKLPVEIKGLAETLSAIRKFEPDLAKNLNKEVRAFLTPIQKEAKGYAPATIPGLSRWKVRTKRQEQAYAGFKATSFPKYNAAAVKSGIKINLGRTKANNKGFSTFYSILNASPAGAIMETSGRKNPSGQPWNPKSASHDYSHSRNPQAGLHFINSMGGTMKGTGHQRGRLIYRAWNENEGKAQSKVIKAVEATILQFKRRGEAQVLRNVA